MAKIKIAFLPDDVASQIAAGEVVERPASVVKELIENAIDANAKHIIVRFIDAGRKLIEVIDDGDGIPLDELEIAISRHATSKLHFADDLFNITTLGFRGEALASIGSISRMTVISKYEGDSYGGKIIVDSGIAQPVEKVGVKQGTTVSVENIFFNVPARLKFLKKDNTEIRQVISLISRYAAAYPNLRFHLFQDNKTILKTSGNSDIREVLAGVYGLDIAKQMIEVVLEERDIQVTGFTSPTGITRSNRREITFFVNGRWVQDTSLATALYQAYRTMLMVGRYPISFINLRLNPEAVDINVHPAKAEIRFKNPEGVFSTVQRAIRRALMASSPLPQISNSQWQTPYYVQRTADPAWEMAGDLKTTDQFLGTHTDSKDVIQGSFPKSQVPILHVVGQVGAAYIIAEGPDGLYLVDQHAAHERILFERFMNQAKTHIHTQVLLEPVIVSVPPQSAQIFMDNFEQLNHLGFDISEFGPGLFQLRGIPAMLQTGEPEEIVRAVVEDLEEDESLLEKALTEMLIARICKRAAVKAGKFLDKAEQEQMIRDLEACSNPRTCPHGRPTMIHLSVDMLERQFGRHGSR